LAYGPDARHRLDIYRPANSARTPMPLLVFMHGGGFIRGDKSERENIGQYFARNGFVTLVPNYRLAPAHVWPAGAEDVVRAYCWAREHGALFGADSQRIFLAGESAGAAHVALAALARRFQLPGGFAGVVLISGVYDVRLEALARRQFGITSPDPRNGAYFGSDFERYGRMSTVQLIDAAPFPLLMTYAELDLLQMQVQAGELFSRLVTQHHFRPDLNVIRGHNHLTQVYSINTGDESLGAPVLKFLRDHS
jgi:acetyl esterase/lipase